MSFEELKNNKDIKKEYLETYQKSLDFQKDQEKVKEYVSNPENWVCVHATKYEPKDNESGKKYIETTGMATGYKIARPSVHFALNHVVDNVGIYGNWDDKDIVILTPYNSMVEQNTTPQEVSIFDTYCIPDPDTGIVLTDDTFIIRGNSDTKELLEINNNDAVYKNKNYTEEEVKEILSYFSEEEIYDYNKAETTKKNTLLKNKLRETAIRISLEKMGKHYIQDCDGGKIATKIMNTAIDNNIKGDCTNKGHSNSIEGELEQVSMDNYHFLEGVKNSNNTDEICKVLRNNGKVIRDSAVKWALSEEKDLNIDFYNKFEKEFENCSRGKYATISEYNKNLDKIIQISSKVYEDKFKEVFKNNNTEEIKNKIKEYYKDELMDDYYKYKYKEDEKSIKEFKKIEEELGKYFPEELKKLERPVEYFF